MASKIAAGLVAGAAGTVALNITTYLDMAISGRPPSELPAKVAARLAADAGIPLDFDVDTADGEDGGPADAERVQHRQEAVGALLGYANGLGMGLGYGLIRLVLPRPPTWIAAGLLGGAAMASSDVPAVRLGLTDPQQWGAKGWLSDVAPHLAYGLVTAMTFEAIRRR